MGLAVECSSCGARFALSDELFDKKVSGRKVSIRCKNCGGRIPVDATGGARPEITWMVSYGEADDREMSSTEIAAALARGEISAGTLVWTEGMAEWLPLAKVPEVAALLPKEKPKPRPPRTKLASQSGATPASPAVGPPPHTPEPGPTAPTNAAAPDAAAAAAAPQGILAEGNVPAPGGTAGLFDAEHARSIRPMPIELATLPVQGVRPQAPKPDRKKVRRQSDAEILGLEAPPAATLAVPPIDLSKLAVAPPPPAEDLPAPAKLPVEKHTAMAPLSTPRAGSSAQSAPADSHAPQRRRIPLWILAAAGVSLLALAVWALAASSDHEAPPVGTSATPQRGTPATLAPSSSTEAATPDSAPGAAVAPSPRGQTSGSEGSAPRRSHPAAATPAGTGVANPAPAAPVPKAPGAAKPVVTAPPASGAAFDRAAASAALSAAAGSASACRKPGDPSGTATVVVTFAPSGRVTSANLSGPPFAGTPTGGCIAATMRRASVPPFAGDKVTVTKRVVIQ